MSCTKDSGRIVKSRAALAAMLTAVCSLLLPGATRAGDTDWIVLPHASASGRMLLHALRDNGKPVSTDIRLDKGGRIRSLRIGNNKNGFTFAGINYCGVAVLATGGDPTRDKNPRYNKRLYSGSNAVNLILRNCRTAEQAVDLLRDGAKKSLIYGSLIFFIADPNRAFIVECSHRHFAVSELTKGFCAYANVWKLPGMQDASTRSPKFQSWQFQREWTVSEMLRRARSDGKISLAESLATSRVGPLEINAPAFEKARDKWRINNTPAIRNSADGVLFEIDREFPGVLSCAYVAFGPPRHTVYLPIPVGAAEKLPAELTPNPWKAGALARNKAAKADTPIDPRLIAFEKNLLMEFAKKREEARQLLRAKKHAEARALLQATLKRQATELDAFLKSLGK